MNERAHRAFGSNDVEALLGTAPVGAVPWAPAGGRIGRKPFDQTLVAAALNKKQQPEPVDPRDLRSTQGHLVRAGVKHYLSGAEGLYADEHNPGNKNPVVYDREGTHIILSGHHRAAAALLRGEQFHAVVVHGGYGPEI